MSPPVFAAVWVAAWAVAWWVARPRVRVRSFNPPVRRQSEAGPYVVFFERYDYPGWRHITPVVATAFAFACDVAWTVLS